MKIKNFLIFMSLIMLVSFGGVSKANAMRADALASGVTGECGWILYEAGDLHIGTHLSDLYDPNEPYSCELGGPVKINSDDLGCYENCYDYVSPWAAYDNEHSENISDQIKSISFSGVVNASANMSHFFEGLSKLESIDMTNLNTSNSTSMEFMFSGDNSLSSITIGKGFNTSNVKDMTAMFAMNNNLSNFNFLNSFDTSKVESMALMFANIGASELNLENFNTSNVKNMMSMFYGSSSLKTIKVTDKFNTSSVLPGENGKDLFGDCVSLVGGNGTKYNSTKTDVSYAVVDSSNTPGYFTGNNTEKYYVVSFETNGGSAVASQSVLEGRTASEVISKKDNYMFDGWYKDSNLTQKFNFNTPITTNITLYAKWQKKLNINKCEVSGLVNKKYNGKYQTQNNYEVICFNNDGLVGYRIYENSDYSVDYKNNKNAGTASILIKGKGKYEGTLIDTFEISKINNPIVIKAKNKKVKAKKVKKKKQVVAPISVSKAQGVVTYSKISGNKKIKVNAKTGKITVKKKTKRGKYKIKVRVTAKGNNNYKSLSKIVTFTIKVK